MNRLSDYDKPPLIYNVRIYQELHKEKDLFANAITWYFDNLIGKMSYLSFNTKNSLRLKIIWSQKMYKEYIENIEREELKIFNKVLKEDIKKIPTTVLLNNILGLYSIRQQLNLKGQK